MPLSTPPRRRRFEDAPRRRFVSSRGRDSGTSRNAIRACDRVVPERHRSLDVHLVDHGTGCALPSPSAIRSLLNPDSSGSGCPIWVGCQTGAGAAERLARSSKARPSRFVFPPPAASFCRLEPLVGKPRPLVALRMNGILAVHCSSPTRHQTADSPRVATGAMGSQSSPARPLDRARPLLP